LAAIIVLGEGEVVRLCREVLFRARIEVRSDLPQTRRAEPVILGEAPHLFSTALELLAAGHDLLLAAPAALSPNQLETLVATRGPRQALFAWSPGRYHAGHRLVAGLVEADEHGWQPRHIRLFTTTTEKATVAGMRWQTLEALALLQAYVTVGPLNVIATGSANLERGALDLLTVVVRYEGFEAYVQVALGEATGRRDLILAAAERRAYVDELNQATPVRLVDEERGAGRWVSVAAPSAFELARSQCLAFLEAAEDPALSSREASAWRQSLAAWQAIETSLANNGAPASLPEGGSSGLRVLAGAGRATPRHGVNDSLLRLIGA
jgi:hypothetical protein